MSKEKQKQSIRENNYLLNWLNATKIEVWRFPARNQVYEFPPKKGKKWEVIKGPLPDKKIKSMINELPGCKVVRIERNSAGGAKVFISVMNARLRAKALDKIYRLAGLYKTQKRQG